MNAIQLIYQPAPGGSIPTLQAAEGSSPPWSERQLLELEKQLKDNFNDFARGTLKTVQFQDRTLQVTSHGDSRMPRLLIQETGLAPSEANRPATERGWLDDLLAEFQHAIASAGGTLDNLERNQLEFVLEEFRDKARLSEGLDPAFVLMASYLGSSEQFFKASDPNRAMVYAVAVRALEKLLPRPGEGERKLAIAYGAAPPDGVIRRALRRLFGS